MEGFNLTIILVLLLILFSSMDFKHKVIQWNCRGLKPNYNEVSLLISEYNPSVFCFQETFLKPDDNISLRGFNVYNYVHTDCLRPSGGASIFVKSSFPQRKIDLQTELQATAISVILQVQSLLHLLIFPSVIHHCFLIIIGLYVKTNTIVITSLSSLNRTLIPLRITIQS